MKKVNAFFIGLVFVLLFTAANAQAQDSGDYFVGNWKIVLSDTPNGNIEVIMHLEKVDSKLQGTIRYETEGSGVKIDRVEEKESSIIAYFVISGYDVNLLLEKEDEDNIKGDLMEMFAAKGKRIKD